ncbi:MAG: nuclear transport factor 2 family protein [Candidatus Hydrogenedentes bacterium]|nr:nuclear transport factor 2 family protein [Candidatus Hydrogenedentota bacterium]
MTIELTGAINRYVEACNRHDVRSALASFSEDAVVHDEGATHRGAKPIETWLADTMDQFRFQLKPIRSVVDGDHEVVSMEVSGDFDGSPVILDSRFRIEGEKIASLEIGYGS